MKIVIRLGGGTDEECVITKWARTCDLALACLSSRDSIASLEYLEYLL